MNPSPSTPDQARNHSAASAAKSTMTPIQSPSATPMASPALQHASPGFASSASPHPPRNPEELLEAIRVARVHFESNTRDALDVLRNVPTKKATEASKASAHLFDQTVSRMASLASHLRLAVSFLSSHATDSKDSVSSLQEAVVLLQDTMTTFTTNIQTDMTDLRQEMQALQRVGVKLTAQNHTPSSTVAAKETIDLKNITPLSDFRASTLRTWQAQILVYEKALSLRPNAIPIDRLVTTLSGRVLEAVHAQRELLRVSSGHDLTHDTMLKLISSRCLATGAPPKEALAAYQAIRCRSGDAWFDLEGRYTLALTHLFESAPRAIPLPRVHLSNLFDILPQKTKREYLSQFNSTLSRFQIDYDHSLTHKQLLHLCLDIQNIFVLLVSTLSPTIPHLLDDHNTKNNDSIIRNTTDDSSGKPRQLKHKTRSDDSKEDLSAICTTCKHHAHRLSHCMFRVGSYTQGATCTHCKEQNHTIIQCRSASQEQRDAANLKSKAPPDRPPSASTVDQAPAHASSTRVLEALEDECITQ